MNDHELARALVFEASQALLGREGDPQSNPTVGTDGELLTMLLAGGIRVARPGDGLLYPGTRDDLSRLSRQRVWILAPIPGKQTFDAGLVLLALWQRGELAAGAVGLPHRGLVLATAPPQHGLAPRSGRPAEVMRPGDNVAAAVRTLGVTAGRSPSVAARVAAALGAQVVRHSSSGSGVVAVVLGETDAHIEESDEYEWNSAGPVAVAQSAGLHTSRLDGSALTYNKAVPVLPDLLICRPPAAPVLLARIRAIPR